MPPSTDLRRQPEPLVQPVPAAVSPVVMYIVVGPPAAVTANAAREFATVVVKVCVNVAAPLAVVVRYTPPFVAELAPNTQHTIVFQVASAGS
jgi:hypothetical protein